MIDTAAVGLLNRLAGLQRRNSGGVILVASNRRSAWADSEPEVKMPVERGALKALEAEGLVMVEPYAETKPRGVQILGMTSKGWRMADEAAGAAGQRRAA